MKDDVGVSVYVSCRVPRRQTFEGEEERSTMGAHRHVWILGCSHTLVCTTHQKEEKKPVEEEEWKPWDREEMSQRQMSAEARASVLRKAKDFNTRFAAQSGSRFL